LSADEPVDTGFDDVLAGNVWSEPAPVAVVPYKPTDTVHQFAEPGRIDAAVDAAVDAALTATVTPEPDPTGLSPAGVQAAKALVQLPQLTWPELARLAREMAMDIKERSTILKEFKLTETQYDFLEAHNDFYREAFRNACREWHAPLTTQERIKVEAAALLEDSLLGLGARMQNKGEGLPGVVEAFKFVGKIAGVGERESGPAAPGERFTINIDLGGDKGVVINASPVRAPDQAGDPVGALPAIGKTP
jgi:hypothetical protein